MRSKKPYVSAICKFFLFLGDVFEGIKKQLVRTEIVTCPITARSFPDWGYAGSRLEWYAGTPVAKAAHWTVTDTEARKRGEQTGLDTLVVHAVNDEY